ncbi:MAG: type II toxin-antitoxin system VapC family toxin [Candidatus Marinimicrobia bacterium]|nr:type II toxin-antitoxin system VapC family toxin [Candidatus Neomarinimicrobiota bacterium]
MNYLLDTCVISELIKKNPDPNVLRWITEVEETSLYLSVLTFGEIHKGIEKLPQSKKKAQLHKWVNSNLRERFKNRIINFDLVVATKWGEIQGQAELAGKPMSLIDGLISATGIAYDLIVVTRNTKDMEQSGVSLVNPWL